MKKIHTLKTKAALLCGACIFLFIQGVYSQDGKPRSWRYYIDTQEPKHILGDTTQQILVWRTPKPDPTYLNSWLDSIQRHCGNFKITLFCGECDSTLMLLTGTGIRTYIQGNGGGKGGGTTCTVNCPQGGGDTIYWCVNFPVNINDSTIYSEKPGKIPQSKLPVFSKKPVINVAVFDTGVDPFDLNRQLYKGTTTSCLSKPPLPSADDGWNFADKNNTINDNYHIPKGHGAIVAKLITEQVNFYMENDVRILPVKIHNQNGESDLFSVLCGFAYAKERHAQVINASFGYYALKQPAIAPGADPGALLLKKYIQYYLTSNHILLIAAAGNKNTHDNDAGEKALYINAGLPVPADLRSLDQVNFYPASLASDPELPNVIAVTTVDDTAKLVSPRQNYSKQVVDIGVNADVKLGGIYYFKNPRIAGGLSEGSSYATPIVTGIICSHYTSIQNSLSGAPFEKGNVLSFLLQSSMHIGRVTTLGGKIKTGVVVNNAVH